jgi:hypothetical protein
MNEIQLSCNVSYIHANNADIKLPKFQQLTDITERILLQKKKKAKNTILEFYKTTVISSSLYE